MNAQQVSENIQALEQQIADLPEGDQRREGLTQELSLNRNALEELNAGNILGAYVFISNGKPKLSTMHGDDSNNRCFVFTGKES